MNTTQLDTLARLRAAMNVETVIVTYSEQELAERAAYAALAQLARKWRRANDRLNGERLALEAQRAHDRAVARYESTVTPEAEPVFPLSRRITAPASGVRRRIRWQSELQPVHCESAGRYRLVRRAHQL